jgi:metallophosphoesterase superfamily enzyme
MAQARGIRHLILPDPHIPDHHVKALNAVFSFIPDYKPHYIHLLGDFFHFTEISKYDKDPYYDITIADEIEEGDKILDKLSKHNAQIIFYRGNHDDRLLKYLGRNAKPLARLKRDGQNINTIEYILKFKERKITILDDLEVSNVLLFHGDAVRGKGGYTAHAHLDKNGISTITGHTHRCAYVIKTLYKRQIQGVEAGCLCNYKPHPYYGSKVKDWQLGFTIMTVVNNVSYIQPIPIFNNSFIWNGKIYRG